MIEEAFSGPEEAQKRLFSVRLAQTKGPEKAMGLAGFLKKLQKAEASKKPVLGGPKRPFEVFLTYQKTTPSAEKRRSRGVFLVFQGPLLQKCPFCVRLPSIGVIDPRARDPFLELFQGLETPEKSPFLKPSFSGLGRTGLLLAWKAGPV